MKRRNLIEKILDFIKNPVTRFYYITKLGLNHNISDEAFLKKAFLINMGYELDLENPKSYNEKLQWLKLNDRNPKYTMMVDKYEVKKYVSKLIGEEYIIPTLGVWENFDDINFDQLPSKFVLKCTHDSGGLVICKDKSNFDKKYAKKIITKSLKRNYYWSGREWPYKDVKPRIIAEEYIEDSSTGELNDYKFFSFSGKVKALFIATDRFSPEETKFDFFDSEFNHLPFTNGHPNASVAPPKPKLFEEMKTIAERLSVGIPQVRVDLYEVDGRIYFGELTFSHWSGLVKFDPYEWDVIFGKWIELPSETE